MSNVALLIAGGSGNRMHQDIPKQFITVNERPVIVYTLEAFENHPEIDCIAVVCIEGWDQVLWAYAKQFNISKLKYVVPGGKNGQDSIRNGVFFLKDKIDPDDHIIVHDAVRPVLPQKAIDEVIRVSHEKGNASSSIECHPPIVYTEDHESGITDVDREHVMLTASPQAFRFSLALKCYEMAEEENYHTSTFTSSLLIHCHERVYFAKGTSCNIKITRKEDLALFEALLKIPEEHLYN